jgi:hypothetical protein
MHSFSLSERQPLNNKNMAEERAKGTSKMQQKAQEEEEHPPPPQLWWGRAFLQCSPILKEYVLWTFHPVVNIFIFYFP